MPRVPVYDQQRVSSRALPTPRVRAPGPTGIEQVGQAIQGAGAQAFDLSIDFRDRADQLRADRALLDFNRQRSAFSTGENGFLLRQGENALDYKDDWKGLSEQRALVEQGLANDRQRALFASKADALMEDTRASWEKHSFQQFGVVYKETADGQMHQALQEAEAAALEGPEAVEKALQRVLVDPPDADGNAQPGILRRYLTLVQGLPKERVDQLVEQFRKDGHLRALQQLMRPGEENPEAAQAYLAKVGGQLGKEADGIRRTVEAEVRKRKALTSAGEAFASSVAAPRKGAEARPSREAALAALDKLDPKDREEAAVHLERRLQEDQRAWDQKVLEHEDTAWAGLDRGGLGAIDSTTRTWLQLNAPQVWRKLRDKAQSLADAAARRQEGKQPKRTEAQVQAMVELRSEVVENPSVYIDMTPEEFQSRWRHRLSEADYLTAGSILARVKKSSPASLSNLRTAVDTKMAQEGIRSKRKQEAFRAYLNEQYLAHLERESKAPALDEIRTWLDDATDEVVVKGHVWDSKKKRWQVGPKEPDKEEEPPGPPQVTERRVLPDGRVLERMSDGTTRWASD